MRGQADQFMGALMGAAVADALGVPHEFTERRVFEVQPVTAMNGYGSHDQPPGTWSDDTSMTLATVAVMLDYPPLEGNHEIFLKHLIDHFIQWQQTAKYTVDQQVFDIGNTTAEALRQYVISEFFWNQPLALKGLDYEQSQGNGSLMHMLPLALWQKVCGYDAELVEQTSSITHAHPHVVMACQHYVRCIGYLDSGLEVALQRATEETWVSDNFAQLPFYERLRDGSFKDTPAADIQGTGYVIHSLEAAYWCVLTSGSYREAVLKAVNLGGDTDTVASITGGIAGYIYGLEGIPQNWLSVLREREMLEKPYASFADLMARR